MVRRLLPLLTFLAVLLLSRRWLSTAVAVVAAAMVVAAAAVVAVVAAMAVVVVAAMAAVVVTVEVVVATEVDMVRFPYQHLSCDWLTLPWHYNRWRRWWSLVDSLFLWPIPLVLPHRHLPRYCFSPS